MRSAQTGLSTVFVCKHGRSAVDACITDFEDQCGFTYLDVNSDENTFIRALELYYKLLCHNHEHTYQSISKTIQHYTKEHGTILVEEEAWNSKAGDMLPYVAAPALGIRIHLYELKPGRGSTKKYITCTVIQEEENNPTSDVYLLRTNRSRVGLLLPTALT